MRSLLTLVVFLTVPFALRAQDDGAMAAQQAQIAEQQNLIVQQQVQQQQDQVNQANETSYTYAVRKPSIVVQPGPTAGTMSVRFKNRARGSEVFYTTDGWTPTPASSLYIGPVTLSETTRVQAIAFSPGAGQSFVVSQMVLVAAPAAAAPGGPAEFPELRVGTSIPLEFTAEVQQRNLQVGDTLPVALAQNLIVGGKLVASQGSAVLATVTHNDKRGFAGLPGEVSFAVHSLTLADGYVLPLTGGRTMQGVPHTGKAMALGAIPFGGLAGVLIHGGGAVIPNGAAFTAQVAPAAVPEPVVSLR
jgi:hypothetical protein